MDEMREQRKIVTALFADLVGSTALAESLDPEDVRDLLEPASTSSRLSQPSVAR